MKKRKLLIIVLFQNLGEKSPYYATSPAPPLPGLLLAALTPPTVDVEVLHEMVRPIDYGTDADTVAISFMDYLAPHAFEVARRFRALGKTVIGGGKFATTHPNLVEPHFDAIVVGEAPPVWSTVVADLLGGRLQRRYTSDPGASLAGIPPPRYDLAESRYEVPIVVETSRGCPHPCTYCALNIRRQPFRMRPVDDVIADLRATERLPWHKRKMAMILDNNFGGDLDRAKEILRRIAALDYWAIGIQFSIECLRDNEFVDLLARARCRMAFIGMESLNEESLRGVQKRQNRVDEYRSFFRKLHERGILTFTGMMVGLDNDTKEYYATLPERLRDVDPAVILPSIAIPLFDTPWYREVNAEGRITDADLAHYEGDHVVFRHPSMTEEEILAAYRSVTKAFYGRKAILARWWRLLRLQRRAEPLAQFLLRLAIVSFVFFKLSMFQRHHAKIRVWNRPPAAPDTARREEPGSVTLEEFIADGVHGNEVHRV